MLLKLRASNPSASRPLVFPKLRGRRRSALPVVLLVLAGALLAGCQVDADVAIVMRSDGSGFVRAVVLLDAEAVAAAETGVGKIEDAVRLTDLDAAGWTHMWRRRDNGGSVLTLRKAFGNPSEIAAVVEELSGAAGPLKDFSGVRDAGLISTNYAVAGTVDLSALGIGADPAVIEAWTANRLDPVAIEETFTRELRDSVRVSVTVRLPGGVHQVLEPEPGSTTNVALDTTDHDEVRLAALGIGALFAVAALAVLLWPRRDRAQAE